MNEIKAPRLTARLFTTDRVTVEVPDVPLSPPATAGKIKVAIPYPASEQRRTVHRVAVFNQDTGDILRTSIELTPVDPGDTLTVEFGEENLGGALPWRWQLPVPAETVGDSRLDAVAANLASLNEIIAELTVKVSDDPEFVSMVRELLRGHSHALGFRFQDDEGGA
jgi:hypothetical protein